MSRSPNADDIAKVKQALRDYRYLSKRISELRKLAAEIEQREEEAKEAHRTVLRLLEEMDVKSNGNAGWEGRVMAFLVELDKQSGEDPA